LRGEPLELVARETNVSIARLTEWRECALGKMDLRGQVCIDPLSVICPAARELNGNNSVSFGGPNFEALVAGSEKLEPKFSSVVVRDSAGKQVDKGDATVDKRSMASAGSLAGPASSSPCACSRRH
jgi:hypothetical protein